MGWSGCAFWKSSVSGRGTSSIDPLCVAIDKGVVPSSAFESIALPPGQDDAKFTRRNAQERNHTLLQHAMIQKDKLTNLPVASVKVRPAAHPRRAPPSIERWATLLKARRPHLTFAAGEAFLSIPWPTRRWLFTAAMSSGVSPSLAAWFFCAPAFLSGSNAES